MARLIVKVADLWHRENTAYSISVTGKGKAEQGSCGYQACSTVIGAQRKGRELKGSHCLLDVRRSIEKLHFNKCI